MKFCKPIIRIISVTTGLLISGSAVPVVAQSMSAWKAASDSSNQYWAKGDFAKAAEFGQIMVKVAERLQATNADDTTLVTSLIRISIARRLGAKPDTANGLAAATRALGLLTPRMRGTLLEAKVYSLNAIFNYAVGQPEKALFYAETAVGQLERLGLTRSSPYWEAQRYRALIYTHKKDTLSILKGVAVIRQLLPITSQLFGETDGRYAGLLTLWANTLRQYAHPTVKQKAEADSVWGAITDLAQKRKDPSSLSTLRDAWNYYYASGNSGKTIEAGHQLIAEAERRYAADPTQDSTLILCLYSVANRDHQLSTSLNPEAASYFERAIALLNPAYELKPWYAELYALISRFHQDIGEYPKAVEYAQKAIDLCRRANQTQSLNYVQTQMTLAAVYSATRDKKQLALAQQTLESTVPIITRLNESNQNKALLRVMALGMLGTVYIMSVPLDDSTQRKADELWNTLIPLTRNLGDSLQLCRILSAAGEYYLAINKADSARTVLQESAQIGKILTNRIYYYITLSNLSTLETSIGHYPEAVRISEEILAAPEPRQLPQIRLIVLTNAVDGHLQLGNLDRAETLAQQAMQLAEELHGTRVNYFYAASLGLLGSVYYQRSDMSNAIFYFEEALDLLEKTARSNDPILARFRTAMGTIYTNVDKEKALYNYRKARIAIELQPNYRQNDDYLHVLQSQMTILRKLNQYTASAQLADSTRRLYNQFSSSDRNAFPLFLEEAYYTYYNVGRWATADSIIHQLEQALTRDTLSYGTQIISLQTIGSAHEFNGHYKEAILSLSKSISLQKSLPGNSNTINAHIPVRIALCQLNLGNRAEAVRLFQESLVRLRTNVAQNLWYMSENQREVYMEPYRLPEIYGMAFPTPAPSASELGLAYDYRLLIQGLFLSTSRKVLRFAESQADTLVQQRVKLLLSVRKTIAQNSLQPSRYVNADSLREVSTQLEKKLGYVAGLIRRQTKAYTWQDVRKSLKPAEAAVEIIRFNQWVFEKDAHETDTVRYAALIVRPEWSSPHVVLMPDGAAMESTWASAYGEEIETSGSGKVAYQRFWQPIAQQLRGVKKVFVAADGIYHLISLPTLYNRIAHRFLLDELQVIMVGSTRELADRPQRSLATKSVLFGFPAYQGQPTRLRPVTVRNNRVDLPARTRGGLSFEELPATETEVNEISRLLNRARVWSSVNVRRDASEPALKAVVSPRILHIATHGFFHSDTLNQFYKIDRLLACGLVLAGASDTTSRQQSEEDGILTGYEASLLNLSQTELVTLSACQTGVGNAYASEGVFGLQRAFLLAGAQSVLMSLWKVNDQLTQQLMIDFYRYWLSGLSKPLALRKAQMKLRKHYPEPYYWGAFVLLGQ